LLYSVSGKAVAVCFWPLVAAHEGDVMAMRDSWIEKREAAQAQANGSRNMSQMHLAKLRMITEEMEYVAKRV